MSEQQRKIRFVRRLTEAPMRACVEALEQTGGDEIEAAKLLRTPEQDVRDRAWLRARGIVPTVEGGPPSASELALQDELERPLRQLLQLEPARDGYPCAWTDALAQATLEGRSDAFLVFADWLQEQGDPRGELIVLQHERQQRGQREPSDEERRLLVAGALGDLNRGRWSMTIEWHLGFVQSLHSALDRRQEAWGQRWLAELSRFLAHPSCLLLRSLSIGRIGQRRTYGEFAEVVAARHLPLLDSLSFGVPRQRYRIGDLYSLGALPALRQLTLRGVDFPQQRLPELQVTDLTLCLDLTELWHALRMSWPQVQSLRIEIPSRVRALGEEAIDRCLACFEQLATALPALRRLELDGGRPRATGRAFEQAVARSLKQAGTPHLELVLVSARER